MQKFKLSWSQIYKSPEQAFLLIGLIFGIIFLLVVPPFQVPDEPHHFFRAYQVAEGKIIAEKRNNVTGGLIPKSLIKSEVLWNNLPFRPEIKVSNQQFAKAFSISLKKRKKDFRNFGNTALYSPIPYLPQAIGIGLGRILYLSPLLLMYLGRLTNLLVSLCLTFLAIKVVPAFKWVFFLLALTPMANFQRASLSADSFINSISLLLVAILIKYAFDSNKTTISRANVFSFCLISILLSLSKQVYFLIPFLIFLVPTYKFGNRNKYFLTCLFASLTSVTAWIVWSAIVKDIYTPLRPNVAIASEQIQVVLLHPVKFAAIIFEDFDLNFEQYFRQFFGVLGWFDTNISSILIILYSHLLVITALIDSCPNVIIGFKNKLNIFIILLFSIFLIYFFTYLSWTPVGLRAVEGIQGRYFAPLVPLFLLLFYNKRVVVKVRKNDIGLTTICFSLFILTVSINTLLIRYYNLGLNSKHL